MQHSEFHTLLLERAGVSKSTTVYSVGPAATAQLSKIFEGFVPYKSEVVIASGMIAIEVISVEDILNNWGHLARYGSGVHVYRLALNSWRVLKKLHQARTGEDAAA